MTNSFDKIIMFLAMGFYSGKSPFAPGTAGTIVGLPLCWLLAQMKLTYAITTIIIVTILAIPISGRAEKIAGTKDPGFIVIDEIAGIMITFIAIPFTPLSALAGFFLFRGFDVIKPFPVGMLDKKLSGGTGIVLDDVAAGIMANLVLQCAVYFGVIVN